MTDKPSLAAALGLEPHPEGGWFRETWRSTESVLGPDVAAGQQAQVVIPAEVWQSAQPAGDSPVLVSCVVSPGFEYSDFEML